VPDAVIFDLDGVLLDSEQLWNRAKAEIVEQTGGRWREDAPRAMMGMSSTEWARYMHEELEVPLEAEDINRRVVKRMEELYRTELPLLPGALQVVEATRRRWPLGLASSSNREIIDLFLTEAALGDAFAATVSSEEVERGKPAPDVYLEAARRMGVRPERSVAVEDSSNGLRAAVAAGMAVIAVPNPHYPPDADALELASATASAVAEITPELVEAASRSAERQ
jgi:HAD superfamily hydrolase (TIGR01509 family)